MKALLKKFLGVMCFVGGAAIGIGAYGVWYVQNFVPSGNESPTSHGLTSDWAVVLGIGIVVFLISFVGFGKMSAAEEDNRRKNRRKS